MSREEKKNMFCDRPGDISEDAKHLRNHMTSAGSMFLEKRKNKQLQNLRFRQQYPYYFYMLDEYGHAVNLCVEIDGGFHQVAELKEDDKVRTELIESGYNHTAIS